MVNRNLLLYFLLLLTSCSTELNPDSFKDFCSDPENGWVQQKSFGDVTLRCFRKPTEYLALQEVKFSHDSLGVVKQKCDQYRQLEYYEIQVEAEGLQLERSRSNYNGEDKSMVEYLSYDFEQNIRLVNGTDTLSPALFHFERSYGLNSKVTFNLAFDVKQKKSDRILEVDSELLGSGKVKFLYPKNLDQSLPRVKNI